MVWVSLYLLFELGEMASLPIGKALERGKRKGKALVKFVGELMGMDANETYANGATSSMSKIGDYHLVLITLNTCLLLFR